MTIIPSLYQGGAEKFVADFSEALSDKFKHTIITYNKTEHIYSHEGSLIELAIPQRSYLIARIIRFITLLQAFKSLKKQLSPKIVISHMLMANMLNVLSRKNEIKICVLHGEWSFRTKSKNTFGWFIKRQYSKADLIISVSEYIKNKFEDCYSLQVPHEVIHIGVPIRSIEKMASKTIQTRLPENYIVYVAGFRPIKNHLKLIKHLHDFLKKSSISLVLVGDGPLRKQIEKSIHKRNLKDKVILLGNLSNPYPIIKNAKISVLTSSSESFSLAVLESMVLGVPVVATDCGGPREIIAPKLKGCFQGRHESDYGILVEKVEKWKSDTLLKEIEYLLNNHNTYNRISESAKKRASKFHINEVMSRYEEVLVDLEKAKSFS